MFLEGMEPPYRQEGENFHPRRCLRVETKSKCRVVKFWISASKTWACCRTGFVGLEKFWDSFTFFWNLGRKKNMFLLSNSRPPFLQHDAWDVFLLSPPTHEQQKNLSHKHPRNFRQTRGEMIERNRSWHPSLTCQWYKKQSVGLFWNGVLLLLMVQNSGVQQLRLVVYRCSYRVWYIPGGCLGFLPSTVSPSVFLQPKKQKKSHRTGQTVGVVKSLFLIDQLLVINSMMGGYMITWSAIKFLSHEWSFGRGTTPGLGDLLTIDNSG